MGIFDKLKNILFEEEELEDTASLPVFTSKEEPVAVPKKEPVARVEEPITTTDNTRFRNVKRDIDLYSIEEDVLSEVAVNEPVVEQPAQVQTPTPAPAPVPKEEPKTVFQTFDEDEFERLNSHIINNENRARREAKMREDVASRRTNNAYSPAPEKKERDVRDPNRYKLDYDTAGKKPFRPSPVISPVYGILDKNYSKDDIVDKKDGMKRERIRPIITRTQDIPSKVEEPEVVEVNIDDVRKKAFGAIDFLERESKRVQEPTVTVEDIPKISREEIIPEVEEVVSTPTFEEEILRDLEKMEESQVKVEEVKNEVPKIQIEEEIIVNNVEPEETYEDDEEETIIEEEKIIQKNTILDDEEDEKEDLISSIEEQLEETNSYEDVAILDEEVKPEKIDRAHIMDDLEKTSTLQILDDIERELNAIKPMASSFEEEDDERAKLERNETLENDLFNLIDSMYEEGEEEND